MGLHAVHENCSGCGVCRQVCALEHFRQVNPSLALIKIEGRFPAPGDYLIRLCDQCGQCAQVCPVEAIQPMDGIYTINHEECTGCMLCTQECPYGVLVQPPGEEVPFKCDLCGQCASLCPRQALVVSDQISQGV